MRAVIKWVSGVLRGAKPAGGRDWWFRYRDQYVLTRRIETLTICVPGPRGLHIWTTLLTRSEGDRFRKRFTN